MKITKDQKGLSSVLFAMVFATILSLLAVGFATLLRNDTRQTIDNTIGYQAQYAAESGVNQAFEYIKKNATPQDKCQSFDLGDSSSSDIASISCVIWDKASDVIFSELGNNPQPFLMQFEPGNHGDIVFKWRLDSVPNINGGDGYNVYSSGSKLPDPLDQDDPLTAANIEGYMPVFKIVVLTNGSSDTHIYYLIPTSGGGSGNYGVDGSTFAADCTDNGSGLYNECSFEMGNTASFDNGYMSVSVIGRQADEASLETTGPSKFDGVQWEVDSTAVALDITKRVQARVSPNGFTWRPGNVVAADKICKDIKVDGINNNTSISGEAVCP